jgi:hypothetical protein
MASGGEDMLVTRSGARWARPAEALRWMLVIGALAVFGVLWIHVAAALLTDGGLLANTWAWLTGLDTPATIVAWVALLPLAVFLWAWQADLASWAMALVMVGLVAWTMLALSGVRRR